MAAGKRLPGFCAAVAALFVLMFVFSSPYMLFVPTVLVAAAVISTLILRLDAKRLVLEMKVDGGGRVGTMLPFRLTPKTRGSLIVACRVFAELEIESVMFGKTERIKLDIPLSGGKSSFDSSLTAKLCGETRIRCISAKITDPFGLFLFRCPPCAECRTVIYPNPVEIELSRSDDLIGTADTEDIVQNRRGNDPSEIFDIREYAPGDDIRSIHWKLSCKTDSLIVRQASEPSHYDAVVLPDMGLSLKDGLPSDEELNRAAAVTVSVCRKLLARGTFFCFAVPTKMGLELREIRSARDIEQAIPFWFGLRLQEQAGVGLECFLTERLERYFTRLLIICGGKYDGDLSGLEQRMGVTVISTSDGVLEPTYASVGNFGETVVLPVKSDNKKAFRIVC